MVVPSNVKTCAQLKLCLNMRTGVVRKSLIALTSSGGPGCLIGLFGVSSIVIERMVSGSMGVCGDVVWLV